ncbi:hypothetical protein BG841_01510 [Marinobacter sp. X15-166B]|nr:hypothetical protein BG841_01510 [Marinobacter sp. X15-166B]
MLIKHKAVSLAAGIALHAYVGAAYAADITIENTVALSFGSFAAGSGGTVTVSPEDVRSASGGVVLFPSATVIAAEFVVRGDRNASYTLELPANNSVKLTAPGAHMELKDFSSDIIRTSGPLTGFLVGGSQTHSIGATLVVGNGQPPGDYSGSFTVTVNYN